MAAKTQAIESNARHLASSPEVSAWVAANAGAGKTQLLVARVLRLLLAGCEPSRILCVTYTRAAAAEMRGRILEALSKWVRLPDAALRGELEALCGQPTSAQVQARARALFATLADMPEALRIDTLHAFCQSLLKRFPLEAGMAPYFSVIDERTSQELLHESAMRMFSQSMTGASAELREAVEQFAARMSETRFHDLLSDIAKERHRLHAVLAGGLDAAQRRVYGLLKVSRGDTEEAFLEAAFHYMDQQLSLLRGCTEKLLASANATDLSMGVALDKWLAEPGARLQQYEAYVGRYHRKDGKPFAAKSLFSKECGLSDAEQAALLAEQERVHQFELRCRALRTAKRSEHLLMVAEAMMKEYDALKRLRAVADYDDLVVAALGMLRQPGIAPWVMYKLDGGIDHVLIDEAQDTSHAQWQIARMLTEEFFAGEGRSEVARTLFAVGDVKQSIFRFQGARPELFADTRSYYARRVPEARAEWASVELPESFRSVRAVLEAVDAVFARPEAGIGLDNIHHLLTERKRGHGGVVEVWPLVEDTAEDEGWRMPETYRRQEDPAQRLAEHIATMIRGWLDSGEKLESKGRAIVPGDIMILVQKRAELAPAILQALRKAGVPVAGADRLALTGSLAVQDLLALGAFLLLPEDDLTLAALLKSPLFVFSEEELFTLAHGRAERSLWERLQGIRQEGSVFAQAYAVLSDLLAKVDFCPPYELYAHVLDVMDGRARFASRMGHAVHDLLDEFLGQVLAYEQSHTPTLQGFMQWMAMADTDIRRDMEQGREVRIMTVHAAKGLQAPIVILPDTAPLKTRASPLLWHGDEADACLLWSPSEAEASPEAQAIKNERSAEDMKEYRRLLYVAMTRAEDRLYICGVEKRSSKGSWHELVGDGLKEIAVEADTPAGKGLRLACPQEKDAGNTPFEISVPQLPMPEALMQPAKAEVVSRTFSPSGLADDASSPALSPVTQDKLYQRGVLIHRLLQYLPAMPADSREETALRLLTRHKVAESECTALIREAIALIEKPEFSAFFGADSLAEVPLSGIVKMGDKRISIAGQVDRLAITDDAVWVLDYKTHAEPPKNLDAVPLRYLRQMAAYRALLMGIYPGRWVRCALLWTAGPELMELPEVRLDEMRIAAQP